MTYNEVEHRHRYAVWSAGRAASTVTCRFKVEQGKRIIDSVGLPWLIANPEYLPSPKHIDLMHREWRSAAICSATSLGLASFTHGIAAKLINVYLKSSMVCGRDAWHENVMALHPPVDSLLLDELYKKNVAELKPVWGAARSQRWSKLDSMQYESLMAGIRTAVGTAPMWSIERYWRGYV